MISKNRHIKYGSLPEHQPDSNLWNRIESELDFFDKLKDLPEHKPNVSVWDNIEAEITTTPFYQKKRTKYVSILLLLLFSSLITCWKTSPNNKDVHLSNTTSTKEINTSSSISKTVKPQELLKSNSKDFYLDLATENSAKDNNSSSDKSKTKPSLQKPKTNGKQVAEVQKDAKTKVPQKLSSVPNNEKDTPANESKLQDVEIDLPNQINNLEKKDSLPIDSPVSNPIALPKESPKGFAFFIAPFASIGQTNHNTDFHLSQSNKGVGVLFEIERGRFNINTGIAFNRSTYKTTRESSYLHLDTADSYFLVDSVIYTYKYKSAYYEKTYIGHTEYILDSITQQFTEEGKNQFSCIEIPLIIGYQIYNRRFKIYPKLGITYNYLIDNNEISYEQASKDKLIQSKEKHLGIQKNSLKSYYSIRCLYQINKQLSVWAEPSGHHYIKPLFKVDEEGLSSSGYHLKMGISIKL